MNVSNPVAAARPKAPKPYQSESTKSLTDEEVRVLVGVIREQAESGSVIGKRDYAMFITYLLTGLRRAEVARLRWDSVPGADAYIVLRDGREVAGPLRIEGSQKEWTDRTDR